ncbi:Zn-ribbon domain-containing OB-fold protein [Paremcibacter congregatus]|uniref:Zn-ribbon domain-containing OB-fold protein n=1 Tax=Paremcibacter congregatus TaxID=2043170 RepID=UPI003A9574EE|tara:strand:- start:1916 stop:2323 length:408 start_codon:yes stop_codon:yes gene_type:complete
MSHSNDIPLVFEGILTSDPKAHFLGSHCPSCDVYQFPAQEICPECLGETQEADMGRRATIHSVTTIRTRAPLGLPSPYSVAYVDMEEVPYRMFALLDPKEAGNYHIGQEVELSVGPLGVNNDNQPCRRPYFSPRS